MGRTIEEARNDDQRLEIKRRLQKLLSDTSTKELRTARGRIQKDDLVYDKDSYDLGKVLEVSGSIISCVWFYANQKRCSCVTKTQVIPANRLQNMQRAKRKQKRREQKKRKVKKQKKPKRKFK